MELKNSFNPLFHCHAVILGYTAYISHFFMTVGFFLTGGAVINRFTYA